MNLVINHLPFSDEFNAQELVLHLFEVDNALLTEESSLADFCGNGLTQEQIDSADSYNAICTIWDEYIIHKLAKEYGVYVHSTDILLTDLISLIKSRESGLH